MTTSSFDLEAEWLVEGEAEAEAFVLAEPLSFWGGLDSASGRIIDQWHPQKGLSVSGKVLVMRAGRGSSSGSSVLAEAIRLGNGPAGIILGSRDAIVTVGAMVATELYGKACPVALVDDDHWQVVARGGRIALSSQGTRARIRCLASE